MISTQRIVYCPNPICIRPSNPVDNRVCANCQTPLIRRYLWVIGSSAATITPGEKVGDRYEVIAPRIWLDTQPGKLPDIPSKIPKEIIPYLRLYQQRLHLPVVYGLVRYQTEAANHILLLENVPIDETGNLYPTLTTAWQQATAVRQVYWLWQILQLWQPLSELGVASSLLIPNNLRVQGWCVRLLQLQQSGQPTLKDLGECWQSLVVNAKTQVANNLQKIVQQMCSGEAEFQDIATQLNTLLLASVAELPLSIKIAGTSDKGPEGLIQNEDSCYPHGKDAIADALSPKMAIVCDGIGGHEGGEVASRLAVQSVKLQIRALLQEVGEQAEVVAPDLLQQQLEASLRVINNVICNCNDEQKRTGTQRMATTMVMAVQVPQRIQTAAGWHSENAHELYLVNVGDSRAYWITREYCQLLTIDDDVATREVRQGRNLYRQALQRPDATALTQALGTKEGELLRPVIQRLIVEEEGLLLLCSDGLSDNHLVEESWRDYAAPVLTGELTLEAAVDAWIQLANQKNGHDNVSVVLTHCRVSSDYLVPVTPKKLQIEVVEEKQVEVVLEAAPPEESEFAASSQVLLDLDISATTQTDDNTQPELQRQPGVLWLRLLVLLVGSATVGLFAWQQLQLQTFQQMCKQLPQGVQQICPPPQNN
ncbi:serine/threonine protein phosphatase [Hapalosiphon sp. MRB220]|nr:serine/threonine protein phosphatase [Hapalosiphon sp. MRB220]